MTAEKQHKDPDGVRLFHLRNNIQVNGDCLFRLNQMAFSETAITGDRLTGTVKVLLESII